MDVRNYQKPADTLKIFKICSLAIILMLGCHACFHTETSAQEAAATAKEAHTFDQGNSASRIKALEMHLKALEKRLAAVEKAPSSGEGTASKHFLTRHQDGFYLYTDKDAGFKMRLGGGLQVDYRYYTEEDRADDRFDIRRARLNLSGRLFHLLGYRASYEFEGSESKNLLDAYGEIRVYGPNVLRFGQFKVPFSLEQQTSYKDLFFAERSMGYYLEPDRDVGIGLRGHFFQDAVNYAVGVFNGDGTDGSSWGSQQDDPELAGRFVIAPFKTMSRPWLKSFQIGRMV